MRVGLFGGSFDPIHRGHVNPVREARLGLDLERVVFLPTAQPPHKPDREFAPALARLTMTELALLDEDGLEVSAFELTPERTAYTIDSLEHFSDLYGDGQVVLLVGSDSLLQLNRWRRWRDIVAGYEIGVLVRPGHEREAIDDRLPREVRDAADAGRVRWVANVPVEISSTELRRRLASGGELPPGLVPELVLKYLRKYPDLYV